MDSHAGAPLSAPREALPQQLSLGVSGYAPQQQFLLPVHELVGKAVAAPTQLLSHTGSLEGGRKGAYCSRPWAGTSRNHARRGAL